MARQTFTGRLSQADLALDNAAAAEITPLLATHGYPAECIAEIEAAFQTLRDINGAQEAAKGATQQATQELRTAMRALNDRMRRFRVIARVVLRRQPEYLEKLGIRVRS